MEIICTKETLICKRRYDGDTDLVTLIPQNLNINDDKIIVYLFDRPVVFRCMGKDINNPNNKRYLASEVFSKHGSLFDIRTTANTFFGETYVKKSKYKEN